MEEKIPNEVLSELYRNVLLAVASIDDITSEVENKRVSEELSAERNAYTKMGNRISALAKKRCCELTPPGAMKKAMMWGSIKASAMMDNTTQHLAEMMLQGTVMGISALRQTQTDNKQMQDEEVSALLKELISLEEGFERKWKSFL